MDSDFNHPNGWGVAAGGVVEAGDIVIIFTGYAPPSSDDELPAVIALTNEAAEYLAGLPIRAFGTDAFGVESLLTWQCLSIPAVGYPVFQPVQRTHV